MSSTVNLPVPLEAVISTDELARRRPRAADDKSLISALVGLSREMANHPEGILQGLVDAALTLCKAHSAGISILEEENGKAIFRWHGIAGEYAPYLRGTTPREFSPCGTVLDRDAVQLMSHLDRHYQYFAEVKPRIAEALLVPFYIEGRAVGTIWVIAHDEERKFDAEDARVLGSLGEFSAAAYKAHFSIKALTAAHSELEEVNAELAGTNKDLKDQIAERERAAQALHEEQESLKLACDVAGFGHWQVDLATGVLTSSRRCRENLGLGDDGDLFYATHLERIHPEDRERVEAAIQGAIRNRADYKSEYRLVWPDGAARWIATHGRAFYAPDGTALTMVGITLDITDRRRTEEQIRHTQKWESLGVLAGGIAHDFNNLLTGILGHASLLADRSEPNSPTSVYAQSIIEAGERAATLTSQMLAYSGKGRRVVRPIDFSEQVQRIFRKLETASPAHVSLHFEPGADLPPIDFDVQQLDQLVTNLVQNASEAIEPSGGAVIVRTRFRSVPEAEIETVLLGEGAKAGEYVTLEVRDTGAGMDEATLARIFDPFFTTKFLGRGLGLAAVAGIIKGHAGALKVTTKPGKGTAFEAFLPAIGRAGTEVRPRLTERPKTPVTILVIDDEEAVQHFVKTALEFHDYRIMAAESGREGLAVFERHAEIISLVLLDLKMPFMSGEEVLPLLKRRRSDVKVIMSSGYDEDYALEFLGDSAADGFLQKPYKVADLREKIEEVLEAV